MSGPEQFDETHMITLSGTESGPHSAISLSRQLKRGDVIGGSYKLLSLIGQGGMGYVFCAEHTMIKRLYALKILAPELLSEANSKRFEVEGRAIANLDHVNIVKVHNMGLDSDNCPFYVMDLLQGQALSDCVGSGLLSVDDALDILTQIAAGLGYAHGKGIVHRDIKPSNVILTNENDRVIVKIVDFGIAKLLPSASLQGQSQTTTGEVVGSPLYMSPEQCMSGAIDERTDIYSLGCTFYEMVAGVPPFKGASALETVLMHQQAPVPKIADLRGARIQGRLARASVPVEYLDVLIEGMLAKRQEDRYESMARLLHDLERLACGKPIGLAGELLTTDLNNCESELDSVSGSGQDTHAQGWTKKQLVAFSLAGAALIGTAAGIVGLTVLGQRSDVVGPEAVQKMPPVIQPIAQPLANAIRRKVTVNPNFSEDSGGRYLAVDDIEEAVKKKSGSDAKQFEAAYEKSGPIVSTTVVVGREKCRMFEFPKCTMGDISTSHGNVVNACGRALVPYYPPLYLNIGAAPGSATVFDYPDILSKIGPDEFDGLTIVGKKNDALGGSFGGSTPQSVSLAAAVAKVRTWTKLTRVGVKYGNLNTNLLSAIDKLPHLNEFEVCKTTGQPEALLKAPFMSRVTSFIVRRQYNYRSVFEKLKDLKSLKRLAVIACELNKEDLELFASYRNIDNFFISNHFRSLEDSVNADVQAMSTVTPDEIVDVIRRMKSLSRVSIGEIKLNQAQLLVLTSCPNLKKIILTGTKYTSAERAQLSAQQPKIDFAEADRG